MKLEDIGAAITKRLWMIIALVLMAALVAAIVAQVQSPVYKVEIAVSPLAPINPTTRLPDPTISLAYAAGLMPTIGNYAESFAVAEDVSKWLMNQGIEITPEQLLNKVSAIPEANSTTLKITFSDGSPTRVADIANAWGDVLSLQALDFEGNEYYNSNFKQMLLGGSINFTNRAIPPAKPTQPKPALYVGLGVFVGLVLGLVLVIGIELFDPHFRSPREAEEALGLPVLGILPKEKRGAKETSLTPESQSTRSWEAFSEMRSNLIFSIKETSSRSMLVAAAIPFPAGPAICATLAASIAGIGRRTLLVDCDLRDRAVSELMDMGGKPGMSDALERGEEPRGKIAGSKISGLDLLPAGKSSQKSTDLLSLPAFQESLRELEGSYDMVIVYAPPLISSIDAAVLATLADLSMIIVDSTLCTRKAAQEAMKSFTHLNVEPFGVVLANVKLRGREKPERTRKAVSTPEARAKAVPAAVSARPRSAEPERTAGAGPVTQAGSAAGSEVKAPAAPTDAGPGAPEPKPSRIDADAPSAVAAPKPTLPGKTEEDLQQVKESVSDDFRRMGEKGAPIPKNWLRALSSDKEDVRESATAAISAYYRSFLLRYKISDESVERITASIIKMMLREGEFASMSEEEAQLHLRQMLLDSGARLSESPASSGAPAGDIYGTPAGATRQEKDEKELKRQEKKRFRLEARGGRKASGRGRDRDPRTQTGDEEGIDWE